MVLNGFKATKSANFERAVSMVDSHCHGIASTVPDKSAQRIDRTVLLLKGDERLSVFEQKHTSRMRNWRGLEMILPVP